MSRGHGDRSCNLGRSLGNVALHKKERARGQSREGEDDRVAGIRVRIGGEVVAEGDK